MAYKNYKNARKPPLAAHRDWLPARALKLKPCPWFPCIYYYITNINTFKFNKKALSTKIEPLPPLHYNMPLIIIFSSLFKIWFPEILEYCFYCYMCFLVSYLFPVYSNLSAIFLCAKEFMKTIIFSVTEDALK